MMPASGTRPVTPGAVQLVANMPTVGEQEGKAMDIVMEPIVEWVDEQAPSASPKPPCPIPNRFQTTRTAHAGRARHPPVSWLVAGSAIAIAVTAVVARPFHDVSGSRTNTASPTSSISDAIDATRASPAKLIANPIFAAPCDYLFEIAADALAIDPDSYASAALTISGTQGLTLNDVVHRDLSAARQAAAGSSTPADRRAEELEAFDVALGRADGTPCSLHSTSAYQQPFWPITEPP